MKISSIVVKFQSLVPVPCFFCWDPLCFSCSARLCCGFFMSGVKKAKLAEMCCVFQWCVDFLPKPAASLSNLAICNVKIEFCPLSTVKCIAKSHLRWEFFFLSPQNCHMPKYYSFTPIAKRTTDWRHAYFWQGTVLLLAYPWARDAVRMGEGLREGGVDGELYWVIGDEA